MSFSDKARQVIATVAPLLGTALGGPLGAAAGGLLAKALGTPAGDDKAAEAALLTASPETLAAIKKAEQDFQARMRELDISEEKLSFDDTASARTMQIQTRDPTVSRLAWVVIGGFITMCLLLAVAFLVWPEQSAKVSTAAWTLLTTLVTYLASEAKQAGAFFFGSSASSQAKDQTLADIAKS